MSDHTEPQPVLTAEALALLRHFLSQIIHDNGGYGWLHIEIRDGKVRMISMEKTVVIKEQK